MTFSAQQSPHNRKHIDVQVCSGPVVVKVTEDAGHLRHFWGELGRVLNEAEKPAEAAPDA